MNDLAVDGPRTEIAGGAAFLVEYLNEAQLPAVVRPLAIDQQGPAAIAALMERGEVRTLLAQHGAVLFRGFGLSGEPDFAEVVTRHYGSEASAYIGGISPRTAVREGQIYESTKVPAHLRIHQHNEMSYLPRSPRDLFFFCERPPTKGGATPLTDCRRLLAEVPLEVRQVFEQRRLRYREHFYGRFWAFWTFRLHDLVRLHRSWRATFNTRRRADVERHCKALGVHLQWLWDDSARVTCRRSGTARHPDSGETVWFNQAATMNVTSYVYGWLKHYAYVLFYPFARYRPFDVSYSDRSRIPHRYLRAIHDATDRVTVSFPWQTGDLLWVDNFLVAHGRTPYKGARRILVAIGPMVGST